MIKANQVATLRAIKAGEEVDGRALSGAVRRGLCTDPENGKVKLTPGANQLLKALDTLGWFQPETKAKSKSKKKAA